MEGDIGISGNCSGASGEDITNDPPFLLRLSDWRRIIPADSSRA